MKAPRRFASASFFVMLFIAIIIAFAVFKIAASVLIPLAIALMLSIVIEPLILLLNKKLHLPKFLCIILIMLGALVAIAVIGTLLVNSFRTILTQYPRYESRFLIIYETIASMFNLPFNEDLSLFKNLWDQAVVRSFVQNTTLSLSTTIFQFLRDTLVVFLFIFFFLSEMRFFRDKVKAALADVMPNTFRSAFTDVVTQIARYISVKFYISLLTGVLVYAGTLLIGLDFPVIWAFLAFVMNFIPSFGSIISGILTGIFALIQFWPQPAPVILVVSLMLAVNMVLGNIIEPKVQGRNLGLSPFVIIVSLSIWGWIWGFAGMVLAVPIMVVVKIICENIEILHPVSILLGTVVEPQKNVDETDE